MSSVSEPRPVLRWIAGACLLLALVLSWASAWIEVPFSRTIYAVLVFGLAVMGCLLTHLTKQRESREQRQQGAIHALIYLGMVLLPIQEGVPSVLRWISVVCVLAAIAAMLYTTHLNNGAVREERRT